MVILSLCGDRYNRPSDNPRDMTPLDRAWRRVVGYFRNQHGGARRGPQASKFAGKFNVNAAFGK